MPVPVIQVGNTTIFRSTAYDQDGNVLDISTATTLEISFRKPDRTVITRTASLTTDGTDGKFEYKTVEADLDQPGDRWQMQGKVIIPALGTFRTNVVEFPVKGNVA